MHTESNVQKDAPVCFGGHLCSQGKQGSFFLSLSLQGHLSVYFSYPHFSFHLILTSVMETDVGNS